MEYREIQQMPGAYTDLGSQSGLDTKTVVSTPCHDYFDMRWSDIQPTENDNIQNSQVRAENSVHSKEIYN